MTDPIVERSPSSHLRLYAGVCVGVLALSWVFVESLAAYWAHFRLGTAGGNGMGLTLIVLPGCFALGGVIGALVARRAVSRGASSRVALGRALFAVVLCLAALLVIEVWRTRNLRVLAAASASRGGGMTRGPSNWR